MNVNVNEKPVTVPGKQPAAEPLVDPMQII